MKLLFYTLFLLVFLFTGCQFNNYGYVQTPLHVPSLKRGGDLSAGVSLDIKSATAMVAYSPVKYVSVIVNANKGFSGNVNALEGGAGVYLPAGKWLFNLVGGAGVSSVNLKGGYIMWFNGNTFRWNNQSQYTKVFFQPSIERKMGEKISIGIAARFSEVQFNSYHHEYREVTYSHDNHGTSHSSEKNENFEIGAPAKFSLIEPTLLFSVHPFKRLTAKLQLGYAFMTWHGQFLEKQQGNFPVQPIAPYDYFFSNATQQSVNAKTDPLFVPFSLNGTICFNISTRRNDH